MASTSETGHAKNVANFQEIIAFCTSYGTAYNPNKDSLKLANLNTLLQDARQALDTVIDKVTEFNDATTKRQKAFEDIKPLFTKIINAFAITNAPDQSIADAKALNKKVQGSRSIKKNMDTNATGNAVMPAAKTISTSQQSYDSIVEHLAKLISLLQSESSYKPNEATLQIASLTALHKAMTDSTKAITTALATVSNARIGRNEVLYKKEPNLYDTAMDIKKYIKSLFGSTSEQYKQISGIKFTKPR